MQRTNIYLDDEQLAALDSVAAGMGVSRAELVRQYIDRGLRSNGRSLDDDLAAIRESFGVLADEEIDLVDRSADGRERHLDRMWAL